MRDLKSNINVLQSLAPALRTATAEGTGIDLRGFDSCVLSFFSAAAITDGTHTPRVQESGDNITFTDVAAADLQGTLVAFDSSSEGIQRVGYVGSKRYVKGDIVVTGSPSTGGILGCNAILGHPHQAPVS